MIQQKSTLVPLIILISSLLFGCMGLGESERKILGTNEAEVSVVAGSGYTKEDPVDATEERRVALVIANGAYQHVAHLPNSVNDAELMAKTLQSLGFTLISNGPVLDADKDTMERAIRDFGQAITGKAVGLFYYSGHGIQWQGQNYLVPVAADVVGERDIKYELVDAGFVTAEMGTAGNRLNLVILDACRNNPFGSRGFKAAGEGLAVMRATAGTVLAFATQPGSKALAGKGHYSPYTEALAKTIRQPGLGLFETLNAAGVAVERATGGQQQPWFNASPIKGEFYFAGAGDDSETVPTVVYPVANTNIKTPVPPVDKQFSLSDLADQELTTRAQWEQWQSKMQEDFDKTLAFKANATLQRTAWTRFLAAYAADNPYSKIDDRLRKEGANRMAAIKDQPEAAPPVVVTTTVLPVTVATTDSNTNIVVPAVPTVTIAPIANVAVPTTPKVELTAPAVVTAPATTSVLPKVEVQPATTTTPTTKEPTKEENTNALEMPATEVTNSTTSGIAVPSNNQSASTPENTNIPQTTP